MSLGIQSVGILLFDEVELLDFAGPLQVFTSARYLFPDIIPSITTIAFEPSIKVSKSLIEIIPNHVIDHENDVFDLFLIPGGMGTRALIKNDIILEKIDQLIIKSSLCCSVCTGALVLAKLGHLQNKKATTHYAAIDLLVELDSSIIPDRSERYIDHGHIIISEGVSAGIDMSFYILQKLYGKELSEDVRKYIEY